MSIYVPIAGTDPFLTPFPNSHVWEGDFYEEDRRGAGRKTIQGWSMISKSFSMKRSRIRHAPGIESEPPYVGCYERKRWRTSGWSLRRARRFLSYGRCCAVEGFPLEMVWDCGKGIRSGSGWATGDRRKIIITNMPFQIKPEDYQIIAFFVLVGVFGTWERLRPARAIDHWADLKVDLMSFWLAI